MAGSLMNRLSQALNKFEQAIGFALGYGFPPGAIGVFAHNINRHPSLPQQTQKSSKPFSLKELLGDGLLWAVPKTRRPLEVRLSRRFGYPDRIYKMIVPKKLIMCAKCGHDHEPSTICGHCWARIKTETTEMQEKILDKLRVDPVEKEVIVLYKGEKEGKAEEFWKNQNLVEMAKARPDWFHSNLMQPSTQQPSDSKDVKPTDLA